MLNNKKRIAEYFPWIALCGAFLLLLFLNVFYLENWLDSDMAAEMMFSGLLAEEGRIFASPNWYYSTEFRFLYTHLVMGPLFRICSNWHIIRMITNIVFYLLLLLSYFYMMAELPVSRNKKILGGAVLLLPFSATMMLHMYMGNTYISHVVILFFCIGLFLRLSEKKGKQVILWMLYILLCGICGISGVRYMLVIQGPLVLASIWYFVQSEEFGAFRNDVNRDKLRQILSSSRLRFLLVSLAGAFCCVAGYAVNVLYVSRNYTFQTYESTNFIDVYQGVFMERLQDAFGSLLMLFGYIPGKSVLSLRGMITLCAFLLLFLSGYISLKARKTKKLMPRFLALLFYSSFLLNSFVFVFTNSTLVPRYYITTVVLLIPLAAVYYEEEDKPLDRYLALAALMGCLILATAKTSMSMITTDKNAARKAVAEELKNQGYTFGYATYWNANIIQELSNGQVEAANISLEDTNGMRFFKWSSMMRYYEPDYHKGKVYMLLTEEEAEKWKDNLALNAGKENAHMAGYVIFHYDTNEDFLDAARKADILEKNQVKE